MKFKDLIQERYKSEDFGKAQKTINFKKYTNGLTSMPFSLIDRPSEVPDTDKSKVSSYIKNGNYVFTYFPMENEFNDTITQAVNKAGVNAFIKLMGDKFSRKLNDTIQGGTHCSLNQELCTVSTYLVFS
jgi:hypothetical protein